jgi:hypothetical protein
MAASEKEKQAQKARANRYKITIRKNGNVTKPDKWDNLSDSQFGDPVNYLFPVPDESRAKNAKSRFSQNKGRYDSRSRSVVRGRLNRLLRKFDVDPIENDDNEEEEEFSQVGIIGPIMLQDTEDTGIVIPAARVATMQHPWWGTLYFDHDLFDSFQDNFDTNVVGRDLIVDAEHGRNGYFGDMALGWVDRVYTEDDIFNMHADPTKLGKEHLGRSYRYASITYHPNYVDQETSIEYGPTLLGVAATNNPFVHRNQPIQSMGNSLVTSSGVHYFMVPDLGIGAVKTTGTIETAGTNSADNFIVEEIEIREGEAMSNKKDQGGDTPSPAAPPVEPAAQAQHQPNNSLTLADGTVVTAEDIQGYMSRTQSLADRLKESEIARVCADATDRGVPPFFIGIARQLMQQCEPDAELAISLDTGEPNEDKQQFNFFSAIAHLLTISPGRIGEITAANVGTPPTEKAQTGNPYLDEPDDLSPEMAEKMARERNQELGLLPVNPEDIEL